MTTKFQAKEAGLTGNLQTVPVSDLLQLISAAAKTGMLSISQESKKRQIYFVKGNITCATASGTEDELLGNLLLAQKRIPKAELERALSLQKLTHKRLGSLLQEMGLINREELTKFLRFQVEEIVYNLFGWSSGAFTFYEGESPPAELVTTQLNTMNVIMEGTRRIDEWIQIQQALPSDDVKVQTIKNPKIKSNTLTMSVAELQVLPLIDGEKNVSELIQTSPVSEFHTRKALYNLISSGLVEAGEKKKTTKHKISDDKLLLYVIIKLYSQSYQTLERMASRKLGQGAKRILKRCFDAQKSLHPFLTKLESSKDFLDFSHLESSAGKVTQPIRFHKLMNALNGLLLEFLRAVSTSLGRNISRQIISQIKKEAAQVVAEQRGISKEYELEEEILKTLKESQLTA
ncbi:MAG: DUF4388 domain-containing protein [candidate division Zixibacteria bacterium]|nr:DUF4388 domain-containing protein [candidate division Zixibacteria bacterium]